MHQHMQDLSTTDVFLLVLLRHVRRIRVKVAHDCKYKDKCLIVQGYIGAAWADTNRCAVWISFNTHATDVFRNTIVDKIYWLIHCIAI